MNLLIAGSRILLINTLLHQVTPATAAPAAARFQLCSWLDRNLYRLSNASASACLKKREASLFFHKNKILIVPKLKSTLQRMSFDYLRLQPYWFAMASGRWLQKELQ